MSSFLSEGNGKEEVDFVFPDNTREMVSLSRAEALIDSVKSSTDPKRIVLSNKSYSDEASAKIATILCNFKNIEVADIHDMIAGRPEDEALRSFSSICKALEGNSLVELDISDNALGAKGIEACRELLSGKELKRVFILNNGISHEAAKLIAKIIIEEGSGCPDLELFNFYNNMCGNEGAEAISTIAKACPNLIDFRYSATRSNSEGMAHIASAVCDLEKLQRLDLADNTIGEEVGEELAQGIDNNKALVHVDLRDGALEDGGTIAVMAALARLSSIKFIDLSGNEMTEACFEDDALKSLEAILSKETLEYFSLDDNELGTDCGVILAKLLSSKKCKSLKKLSLCQCELTAAAAYSIAKAVVKLPKFESLLLDGNEICARGVDEIQSLFEKSGRSIKLGEMEDNDDEGDDDLDDVLDEDDEEEEEEEEDGDDKKESVEVDDLLDSLTESLTKATI
jgi:Ran GTPase-activating protein 1